MAINTHRLCEGHHSLPLAHKHTELVTLIDAILGHAQIYPIKHHQGGGLRGLPLRNL